MSMETAGKIGASSGHHHHHAKAHHGAPPQLRVSASDIRELAELLSESGGAKARSFDAKA